jgi:hypothetical protein
MSEPTTEADDLLDWDRARDGLMADAATADDACPTLVRDWPDLETEHPTVAEPSGPALIFDDGGA